MPRRSSRLQPSKSRAVATAEAIEQANTDLSRGVEVRIPSADEHRGILALEMYDWNQSTESMTEQAAERIRVGLRAQKILSDRNAKRESLADTIREQNEALGNAAKEIADLTERIARAEENQRITIVRTSEQGDARTDTFDSVHRMIAIAMGRARDGAGGDRSADADDRFVHHNAQDSIALAELSSLRTTLEARLETEGAKDREPVVLTKLAKDISIVDAKISELEARANVTSVQASAEVARNEARVELEANAHRVHRTRGVVEKADHAMHKIEEAERAIREPMAALASHEADGAEVADEVVSTAAAVDPPGKRKRKQASEEDRAKRKRAISDGRARAKQARAEKALREEEELNELKVFRDTARTELAELDRIKSECDRHKKKSERYKNSYGKLVAELIDTHRLDQKAVYARYKALWSESGG